MIHKIFISEKMKLKKICYFIPLISSVILILFTCVEWYAYFRKTTVGIYGIFNALYLLLPFIMLLTIAMLTSIIAETEHEARAWKVIFSLPLRQSKIYICKLIWICLFMLETCALIIIGLSILWIIYTSQPLPFLFLIKQVMGCLLASVAVLTIQLWISIRISNQAIPLTIGVIGGASSLSLAQSQIEYLHWLPWSYPSLATPFFDNYKLWIILSIIIGVLFLGISSVMFEKSEFK
ncbi:ABC-2 family transporter protein [Clostridium puniceum]|uniref:ABC-2 family transporter protein n=1 Tax=Clostridium puniceum TaxID=29367 RepID=A0A1S8TE47_9CLOT|nr:ABC transporter permease [Clostridium puniceum]OOM75911.1 ABC-2 family transporter protein [Clostridium puniceum]